MAAHRRRLLRRQPAQVGAAPARAAAFLWVRPDRQAGVHPLVISHDYGNGFAREFAWQGTRDLGAWLAVPRAIEFMADLGGTA